MILQVGVKAFLRNEKGAILLLHRNSEKYGKTRGAWDMVGGRIDPGSPLIENLKREIREETGLSLVDEPRLIAAQDILSEERHVVRLTYVAQGAGEVTLDQEEHTDFRWFTLSELKRFDDLDVYAKELLEKGLLDEV